MRELKTKPILGEIPQNMDKNGHVPGINSNTRTFGILRGLEDEHMGHPQPQAQFNIIYIQLFAILKSL